jgi:hypothetical protein
MPACFSRRNTTDRQQPSIIRRTSIIAAQQELHVTQTNPEQSLSQMIWFAIERTDGQQATFRFANKPVREVATDLFPRTSCIFKCKAPSKAPGRGPVASSPSEKSIFSVHERQNAWARAAISHNSSLIHRTTTSLKTIATDSLLSWQTVRT